VNVMTMIKKNVEHNIYMPLFCKVYVNKVYVMVGKKIVNRLVGRLHTYLYVSMVQVKKNNR
jgi:hypothetical protein